MKRFIFLSFTFMALGFYELSGGAGFDPMAAREAAVLARAKSLEPQTQETAPRFAADQTPQKILLQIEESAPEVTQAALNLVTFEAAASPPSYATAREAKDVTAAPQTSDTPDPDVIEQEPPILPSIAFVGTSAQASSSAVQLPRDIRSVAGVSVNMRSGPGTHHSVVTQLGQNTQVEIIQDTGTGWVQLRPVLGGPTGWVADFLLNRS